MFKDRAFNISILFSTAWHLFWIFAIGIVITPSIQPSSVYQEVDFLGPILEKTAFDLMVEEARPQAETHYAQSTLLLDKIYLKPIGPERKVLKEFMPDSIRDRFNFSLQNYIRDTKEIPLYFAEDIRVAFTESELAKREFSDGIEGPAGKREIISKPKPLTVPGGFYNMADGYVVKLKFFVSDNGIVYGVEPIFSSGYPEIDLQAIKYLKGWRFSPLSMVERDKSDWGTVTVRIDGK